MLAGIPLIGFRFTAVHFTCKCRAEVTEHPPCLSLDHIGLLDHAPPVIGLDPYRRQDDGIPG